LTLQEITDIQNGLLHTGYLELQKKVATLPQLSS
jgi:hypothetical protein